MGFGIKIDQGDWVVCRGGNDWGRGSKHECEIFDSREEAQEFIDNWLGGLASIAKIKQLY